MFVVFRGENGYHVDKMQMNGIGIRTKFVESNLLGPKVSLCYDTDQNRIFWSDQGTGVIESAEITGSHFSSDITNINVFQVTLTHSLPALHIYDALFFRRR